MCLLAIKQVGSGRWDVVVENNTVVEFDEVGFPPGSRLESETERNSVDDSYGSPSSPVRRQTYLIF